MVDHDTRSALPFVFALTEHRKLGHAEKVNTVMLEDPPLESMSLDQLWELHKKTREVLAHRLETERRALEDRIRQLDGEIDPEKRDHGKTPRSRKPYPKVHPKYRNPVNPEQTWAGRGKQPRWLADQIRLGKQLDDFRVKGF